MLNRARDFVRNTPSIEPVNPYEGILTDLALKTERVNEDIVKVTVTAQAPHPGYGLEIANIAFEGKQAYISWRVVLPDPNMVYPQVITDVSAITYIPAGYEAVLAGMLSPKDNSKPANDGSASETAESPAVIPKSAPKVKKAS